MTHAPAARAIISAQILPFGLFQSIQTPLVVFSTRCIQWSSSIRASRRNFGELPALESRRLHGAACHGCALVAETSCEMRNDYLDRALVVPVLGFPDAAFFGAVA
jgi:hypothetical protein